MAVKAVSFQTGKELADYINDTPVPRGQILSIHRNMSGWLDLLYDNDEWAYAAGTGGGTVSVPAGATVQTVSAQGAAGDGTITIDGGSSINVASGGSFEESIGGRKVGAFDIVFSANLDYYVSWTA